MQNVIVIGAGVTGLSTAYHLARRSNVRVVVVDKGPVGDGSSGRAAGICTGLLWSEAGVSVRQRCFALYDELSRDLDGYEFRRTGCLNLFSPETWPEREKLLSLYDRLGAPYQIIDARRIGERWSCLATHGDIIGLHDPLGGYSEPSEYLPAITSRLRSLGVRILENQPVLEFLRRNERIVGVRTAEGRIDGEAVVCTVYSWTRVVLEKLGIRLPVKAFVHQRYLTSRLPEVPQLPAVNANPLGIYFRPALRGRVLAGIETLDRPEFIVDRPEFHMSELHASAGTQEQVVKRLASILPCTQGAALEQEQIGLLTFSMDGEPILGPVSCCPGLFVGLAFHSGGFAYNPGTGELLAQYIVDGATKIDVSSWSPDRFDRHETEQYLALTIPQRDVLHRRH
jgi:sarcosine oxidase subunit beta